MKQKIILIVCITFAFGAVAIVVALASQSGGDYVAELVRAEQKDHYQKMRSNIDELAIVYQELQEYLEITEKRQLTSQEREDISEILRHLEEIKLNISRRSIFYYEDTTAHFFFEPKKEVLNLFDEARNTPLYIDRCVRFAETGFTIPYLSRTQQKSMQENCTMLFEEIERLR